MHVALHHGQSRMPEVLFQQKDVSAVKQEHGGVGMAHQVGMEPVHP